MDAAGITLQVSYTRVDERGTCYRAANWTPTTYVRADSHTHGNRSLRWLPGLYEPSTEKVDRVRWERGPRAPYCEVDCEWNEEDSRWIRKMKTAA